MSWRNQGITGSNNIPLGTRRRFGGDDDGERDGGYTQSQDYAGISDSSYKRGRSPVKGPWNQFTYDRVTDISIEERIDSADGQRKRKKRNRWGDAQENKAAGLMGLPTMIMANMTTEQLEAYTLHLRIEEISQKLRINDVVPADGDRSVLPPEKFIHVSHSLADHRPRRHSMTTLVDVSIPENTDIVNALKMNDTNRLKRR